MTKGVWTLQDVRDEILNSTWVTYDGSVDSGELWTWGNQNDTGFVGDNTRIHRSSPVQIPGTTWLVTGVNTDSGFAQAIKTDGTMWTWGNNSEGQLGINLGKVGGVASPRSSPVQIPGTQWCGQGSGAAQGFGLKTDGTLWGWGCNSIGRLGDVTVVDRSSPVQIPGTTWCAVVTAGASTLALKTDNTLWAWGCGTEGVLGTDDTVHRSSPVQVPGTGWCQISLTATSGIATKTDGTLWSWGSNSVGSLGNNTVTTSSSPVQIPGTQWVCGFKSCAGHTLAKKSDKTIWTWGSNSSGRLGLGVGDTTHRSSPTQIPGTQWNTIGIGGLNAWGIKTNNTLWAWGSGSTSGTLINADVDSPNQIPGTNWISICGGGGPTMARKSI